MGRDDGGSGLFHRERFAWRRRLASSPKAAFVYRWCVGVFGGLVTVAGLIMVPFPGPGWLVVFVGVAIIGTEFDGARRLHRWGWGKVQIWARWIARRNIWVRGLVALGTFAFVTAVVWVSLRTSGALHYDFVPAEVQDLATQWFFL